MTKKITNVVMTVNYIPLPPEHAPAYWEAWRILVGMVREALEEQHRDEQGKANAPAESKENAPA